MKRFLVPTILLLAATSLFAQTEEKTSTQTRIEKESATDSGDRGLFTIPSVETLNKGQYGYGGSFDKFDRTPRSLHISTLPLSFSYGLLSRLTITGTVDSLIQIKATNLAQPGFYSSYPYVSVASARGFGDTYVSAKYRIWRQKDNIGGMSLRGTLKFGTADPTKGLGTGAVDGGVDLIFTSVLPFGFLLDSLMGINSTQNGSNPYPVTIKDDIRSGLGIAWPSTGLKIDRSFIPKQARGTLQGIFEYVTDTFIGASSPNVATVTVQNPSDMGGGIRYMLLDRGLTFNAAFRVNTAFDRTFPNNSGRTGFTFGASYTKPVAAVGNNHYPVIALEADSLEVTAGTAVVITASGFDADNDPLTYSWTSTGGQIDGTGEKVTFRTTGLAPGTYTVRATASDGRGGVTTAQVDITVKP